MRVVHLALNDGEGGAAQSALNLHNALLKLGTNSSFLVEKIHNGTCLGVIEAGGFDEGWETTLNEILLWNNRSPRTNTYYSLNYPGSMNLDHECLRLADVINLHWVAGSLSASSICELAALGKPIIWTLHDMRALTGGCHFPSDCLNYQKDCSDCPQLIWNLGGMVEQSRKLMERALNFAGIHLVAPSSWLRSAVDTSVSARNCSASTIPYGIDTDLFAPCDIKEAREMFGLHLEVTYILLASHHIGERRKGFPEALAIIEALGQLPELRDQFSSGKIRILLCGQADEKTELSSCRSEHVGFISHSSMPYLYSASDLILFTSIQDNLPNIILEAMACGTPIAAHDLPGVRDLMGDDETCGFHFPIGEIPVAIKKITQMILDKPKRRLMGQNARKRVIKEFSLLKQGKKYLDLYEEITNKTTIYLKNTNVTRDEEWMLLQQILLKKISSLEKGNEILQMTNKDLQVAMKSLWVRLGQAIRLCHRP